MVRWMWLRAGNSSGEAAHRELARDEVGALLPKLLAHHRWWYRARDPQQTDLQAQGQRQA